MNGIHQSNKYPINLKSNDGIKQISFDQMHDQLSLLYKSLRILYTTYLPGITFFDMKGSKIAKGMDLSIDDKDEGKKEIKFWVTPEELYIKFNEKVMHLKNAGHVMRQCNEKTGNENNKIFSQDEITYLSNLTTHLDKIAIQIQNEKKMSLQDIIEAMEDSIMENIIKNLINQTDTKL